MNARSAIAAARAYARSVTTEALRLRTRVDWTRPSSIRAHINERCNYRCQYCRFWRLDEYRDELSIEEWKAALASLQKFIGRYRIQFSGGEPFLKRGFVDLLEFCHRRRLSFGVITNGSALRPKTVRRVVAARPFNIDVSVDSWEPSINDVTRGVRGATAQVERAVRSLSAERSRQQVGFPIRLKAVVTRSTFRTLVQTARWASEIGADSIDFSPVRPWSSETEQQLWIRDPDELAELAEIAAELVALRRAGGCVETSDAKLLALPAHFRGDRTFSGAAPCRVGMRDYHIRPNGDVETCWFFPPLGNVRDASARQIWRGPVAERIRAETIACDRFGSVDCANSCLTHRSLRQELQRVRLFARRRFAWRLGASGAPQAH